MTEKILFVDDEENILYSMKRELRKRFTVVTATSGALALEVMKNDGPFAVIVSDMRMPEMDGIQLLTAVKDIYPDTIRLMLTGNADQETAIEAVNKGQIFRFLNKPCPSTTLVMALVLAIRQYRLVTAEKDLLDNTLKGAITVLSEVLSLANPIAFSSALRIKGLVVKLIQHLPLTQLWRFEIAALMSQIGCIAIPSDILNKNYASQPLSQEEEQMFRNHPQIGAKLLEKIPRLESVAQIIAQQSRDYQSFDGTDDLDEEICLGAQILKIAIDFDTLLHRGMRWSQILHQFGEQSGSYNPELIEILAQLKFEDEHERILSLDLQDISVGMIAEQDIKALNGVLIAPKGQEVTWSLLQGLKNFSRQVGIKEPILVRVKQ
jgi:response regulator RpfG family c-di-GMP phosphodiesterase